MTSKKQKVAKKKFLEQNPQGSYTNELKILQIQKQLDRKVNKNHHLNELMDELFYPDVRYANEKLLQQNLLNLANNPQQALAGKSKQSNKSISEQQEDIQKLQQIDELVQQIYLCQIPSQLFQLYLKNSELFTHYHLGIYLERLEYYFKNKTVIQDRVTYKWKQSLEKLKITDAEKKKKRRCPYIFIEQEELIRDEEWNKVVKDINKKILFTTEQIANQKTQENVDQLVVENTSAEQQQNHVNEDFYSLQNNCELVLKIKQVANYVPQELFNSIVKKMFVILDLDKKEKKSQEKLPLFEYQQKVKLLKVLSLKSMAKSTMTKSLHIDSIELSQKEEQKLIAVGKKFCEDILNSTQCSASDLEAVIRSDKGQLKFLNSMLLDLCKPKILQFLSSTNLQRSIDYLNAFWQNGTTKDVNFIQVLVFDIYRKLPYSISKSHLLSLFHMIKNSRLYFRQSKINITVSEIYPRFTESVTKYLNKNQLSHEEIKSFVNSIYENYPLYKGQSLLNILEMITTAIVKIGEGFRLEEISQLLFKTTVMGHRSRVFSKYVFQRYLKEYRKLMKEYKESKIQLISDKSSKNVAQKQEISELPSMNEVMLEQSLIMMLWSFVVSFNSQNTSMPLSEMIEIYPVHIRSQDPMIDDLIEDLNVHLKDLNFFPIIKNKEIYQTKTKDNNRRRSLKSIALLLKTNTVQNYRYHYNDPIAIQLLQKLQEEKEPISNEMYDKLVLFLIRYHAVTQKMDFGTIKLPDRWNDSVLDIFSHRRSVSHQVRKVFLQNIIKISQQSNQNEKLLSAQRISKLIQEKAINHKHMWKNDINGQKSQKSYKLYEIL